ncbi:MAG: hypothetical protein OXT71_06100 [Acidobacteriota bacterium]|nr:hypothetical protein [Acidobacteriota bacterium]
MINLNERLSEFSYGYGVTREVENLLLQAGCHVTPFLPSLVHEAELGFDVSFHDPGFILMLQFKLGQELQRFRRSKYCQSIPPLTSPFWRFDIDISARQFKNLLKSENADAHVYYVAPRFSDWLVYEQAFLASRVLYESLILRPSEIMRGIQAQAENKDVHRIVYDETDCYVCSELFKLRSVKQREIFDNIVERKSDTSLEESIQRLFDCLRTNSRDEIRDAQQWEYRNQFDARSRQDVHARALIIGMEVWIRGAQLVFVTESA